VTGLGSPNFGKWLSYIMAQKEKHNLYIYNNPCYFFISFSLLKQNK
jgi:dTDP-4-dehydrorhamnose 3,5-epimerase-like enzyme